MTIINDFDTRTADEIIRQMRRMQNEIANLQQQIHGLSKIQQPQAVHLARVSQSAGGRQNETDDDDGETVTAGSGEVELHTLTHDGELRKKTSAQKVYNISGSVLPQDDVVLAFREPYSGRLIAVPGPPRVAFAEFTAMELDGSHTGQEVPAGVTMTAVAVASSDLRTEDGRVFFTERAQGAWFCHLDIRAAYRANFFEDEQTHPFVLPAKFAMRVSRGTYAEHAAFTLPPRKVVDFQADTKNPFYRDVSWSSYPPHCWHRFSMSFVVLNVAGDPLDIDVGSNGPISVIASATLIGPFAR